MEVVYEVAKFSAFDSTSANDSLHLSMGGGLSSVYAMGGGGGGSGGVTHQPTGIKYRCFANIGASTSETKQGGGILGGGQYCIPSPQGKDGCQKDWNWFVDGKNDTVVETATSNQCQFQCKVVQGTATIGSSSPFQTHSYCVKESQWSKVAKCVDKSTGEETNASMCNYNGNYYYKPRCDSKDSKEQCTNRLKTLVNQNDWKFCYDNGQNVFQQAGGQSVIYTEYKYIDGSNATFPCEQQSMPPSGGGAITPDKPAEPLGNLVIIDWADSQRDVSLIHTKISGNAYTFKIYASNASGKISSGLQSVTCEIPSVSGTRANATVAFSLKSMMVYKYSVGENAFPESGNYTIKCEGANKEGEKVSAEASFLVAPHSYQFGIVSAVFNNTNATGGVANEILLDKITKIDYNKTQTVAHDNQSWTKKPVVKIGELLDIQVNEISALTKQGTVDVGVDANDNMGGTISIDEQDSKVGKYAIKDANAIPPKTSTTNSCDANLALKTNDAEMVSGMMANMESVLTISADNALAGQAEVVIYDKAMNAIVEKERANQKCIDNHGNFPCPYPAKLKVSFDYQVAPNNFKAELLDKNNNAIKVLYFGQGNSPLADSATKIRVSALEGNNNIAKDFIIKGSEFKDGVANVEGILQVNKGKDVPFTPAMKSEPVFTQDKFPNGFPANMEFAGFAPADTYYPSYKDVSVNPNDPLMILRGRINAIDTDNNATNFGIASPTKVYYEFQCEYCDLDKVAKVTGWARYENKDKSPTQQGWFIDRTFDKYNETKLEKAKVEIENLGNAQINNISAHSKGEQQISYSFLGVGTYKLNIKHGNFKDAMPYFLLYNAYWSGGMKEVTDKDGNKSRYLESGIKWHTSAFIRINGAAKDENRDYGVDTGGAKNTRSGGRIGRY